MPDIPGNQSTKIEWEYDIAPVQARPVAGQTAPPASSVIQPEMPVPEGMTRSAADTGTRATEPPGEPFSVQNKRLSLPLIAGTAVFAVIIAGLLITGLFRHYNGSAPADTGNISSMEATSTTGKPQKMTEQQEEFAATLFKKLPEVLVSLSKDFTQDPVFLEALSQAKLTDVVFSDNQVDFSIMLPDPRADSLDQLGVSSYIPHSGAQAYIHDNYAKLCDMDKITTVILIPATLYPKKNADGSLTVDWSLPVLSSVPYNYEQTFMPQMSKYMKDKGFYTAAMELIMPDFQSWDKHTGTERDMTRLDEYFQSLAESLAPKGITLNGKNVIDVDMIKQTLKTRFVRTWAFDSPDIQTSGNQTVFKTRTVHENWFQDVSDELTAQYEAGAKSRPANLNALEAAYLENVRQKINAAFGSNGLQGNDVYNMQYAFTWQELGNKGIAACPELVDVIRQYLFSYDFQLMFTAATALGITSN